MGTVDQTWEEYKEKHLKNIDLDDLSTCKRIFFNGAACLVARLVQAGEKSGTLQDIILKDIIPDITKFFEEEEREQRKTETVNSFLDDIAEKEGWKIIRRYEPKN